ncbi:MAG TPA: carboxypeptidase regulatory-like domain-containing protein, partial [Gemmatimonadales bacterium]|nr:carboxypeptidase regulatory-like domain-containing protein [Gemmatimonadales bacterium]
MLAVLFSVVVLPVDTVSGRVIDTGGQPVSQAIVEITELGRSVTATENGAFRVVLAPGRYTLTVRRPGYAPVVREISVGAAVTPLEIVLAPSAFRLEPVTVTATRQPLAMGSSPLPADALAGPDLRQAQSVSLAHVVATLPGVNAITTGSQIGKPMIRGFSGPRVL